MPARPGQETAKARIDGHAASALAGRRSYSPLEGARAEITQAQWICSTPSNCKASETACRDAQLDIRQCPVANDLFSKRNR
jgi:hypothetical protein